MVYYHASVGGVSFYLINRLRANGFYCRYYGSRSVLSDLKAMYKHSSCGYRDDRESESLYIAYRYLGFRLEDFPVDHPGPYGLIRVSNHAYAPNRKHGRRSIDYEIYACVRYARSQCYLRVWEKLSMLYDFPLNGVEKRLMQSSNFREYAKQIQIWTKRYWASLKTANSIDLPNIIKIYD